MIYDNIPLSSTSEIMGVDIWFILLNNTHKKKVAISSGDQILLTSMESILVGSVKGKQEMRYR